MFMNLSRNTDKGDIRSENADISNDLSCENHENRMFKVFCDLVINAGVDGPLDYSES